LDTYANDRGHAIISVLHDMNHALHACDRLLLIKEGNLYADIPSNRDALPLLEDLYGLQLEYVQTTSQALFVSSRMTRRCVA
jgi:iron complex transport system ATP-binding protein